MNKIFETSFLPGTQGIRVGDVEIETLGEVDGKVIVACDPSIAAQNQWTRRYDLEAARRAHYEDLGAKLLQEIHAAHDERIAKEIADREEAELADFQRQLESRGDSNPDVAPTFDKEQDAKREASNPAPIAEKSDKKPKRK